MISQTTIRFMLITLCTLVMPVFSMHTMSSTHHKTMIKALKEGDTGTVSQLIQNGFDIRKSSYIGEPLTHVAADAGQLSCVKLLEKNGLDIRGYDKGGFTILHHAVVSDNSPLINYLIYDRRLDKNKVTWDEYGFAYTPLHMAVCNKKFLAIKCLVCARANINVTARDGVTPLHLAASKGYTRIADYLIQNGADQLARDAQGNSALDIAARCDQAAVIRMLIEKYCFNPVAHDAHAYKLTLQYDAKNAEQELYKHIEKLEKLREQSRQL